MKGPPANLAALFRAQRAAWRADDESGYVPPDDLTADEADAVPRFVLRAVRARVQEYLSRRHDTRPADDWWPGPVAQGPPWDR